MIREGRGAPLCCLMAQLPACCSLLLAGVNPVFRITCRRHCRTPPVAAGSALGVSDGSPLQWLLPDLSSGVSRALHDGAAATNRIALRSPDCADTMLCMWVCRYSLAPARAYAESIHQLFALREAGFVQGGSENLFIIADGDKWYVTTLRSCLLGLLCLVALFGSSCRQQKAHKTSEQCVAQAEVPLLC